MRLMVLRVARRELLDAVRWYEETAEGLGVEFASLIREALRSIQANPLQHPVWESSRTFRRYVMHRFPFVIFCRVRADRIVVYAFAHTSRRPGYWRSRRDGS